MLKVNEEVKDLGTIQYGTVHSFEIEVENTTAKDVPINKVQVSCSSCTKATITKLIKGSSKEKLKVTFTPGVVGQTNKWVDLIYDGDQTLRIKFKALVNG